MIPDDLKIFSFIYEYRFWVMCPLTIIWIIGGIYLLIRLKKIFFLWLLIFPLFLAPLYISTVWCGWHYRMELYDQFAETPQGWHDIDNMPKEIREEYAKHDYHPRFRDIQGMALSTIVFTPLLYILGLLAFSITKCYSLIINIILKK